MCCLKTAHLMKIFQFLYLWFLIAERAFGILSDLEIPKFHIHRIVDQKLSHQGLSLFQNEFDRFGSLYQSNLPGHNSQDACLVSAGDQTWRRWLREKATQTRPPFFWGKDAGLAFELENSPINVGLPSKKRSIIDEIFRGKVI